MKRIFKSLVAVGMLFASLGMSGCTDKTETSYALSIKPTEKGQGYIDNYNNLKKKNIQNKELKSAIKKADSNDAAYTMYIPSTDLAEYKEADGINVKPYTEGSVDRYLFGIGTNRDNTASANTVIYTSESTSKSSNSLGKIKYADDNTSSSSAEISSGTTSDSSSDEDIITTVEYSNSDPIKLHYYTEQTVTIKSTVYSGTKGVYTVSEKTILQIVNIILEDKIAPAFDEDNAFTATREVRKDNDNNSYALISYTNFGYSISGHFSTIDSKEILINTSKYSGEEDMLRLYPDDSSYSQCTVHFYKVSGYHPGMENIPGIDELNNMVEWDYEKTEEDICSSIKTIVDTYGYEWFALYISCRIVDPANNTSENVVFYCEG